MEFGGAGAEQPPNPGWDGAALVNLDETQLDLSLFCTNGEHWSQTNTQTLRAKPIFAQTPVFEILVFQAHDSIAVWEFL